MNKNTKRGLQLTLVIALVILFNNCGKGFKISENFTSTSSVSPTPATSPTPTPVATPMVTPSPTPTISPTPTPTVTPSPNPTPSPTPTPSTSCITPVTWPAATRTVNAGPSDWCAKVNAAQPGDEIVLASGNYSNPCGITVAGTADKPIYLRSQSTTNRAVLNYSGTSSNVTEVSGSYFVMKDLTFSNISDAALAIRIKAVQNMIIENNQFINNGQSITANSGNSEGVIIRNNTFTGNTETVLYLGCHDGSCVSKNFIFENNFIDASSINTTGVGYGIEIKLNSYGVLRDNSIFGAQGPNMMVYGNNSSSTLTNTIEGNYLENSRNDASLNIGGGPARVINNVIVSNSEAIFAQNYGGRGLQKNIMIGHNTVYSKTSTGINVNSWSTGNNNYAVGNAVYGVPGISPSTQPAPMFVDNFICALTDCFATNLGSSPYNFSPKADGPLLRLPVGYTPPKYDFYGLPRTNNQIGAILLNSTTQNNVFTYKQARPARKAYCFEP